MLQIGKFPCTAVADIRKAHIDMVSPLLGLLIWFPRLKFWLDEVPVNSTKALR